MGIIRTLNFYNKNTEYSLPERKNFMRYYEIKDPATYDGCCLPINNKVFLLVSCLSFRFSLIIGIILLATENPAVSIFIAILEELEILVFFSYSIVLAILV